MRSQVNKHTHYLQISIFFRERTDGPCTLILMMERRSREVKRERVSAERSRSRSSRGRDRSGDRPAGARLADKRVYISNIPYDSRWQDIKDLFRKEGMHICISVICLLYSQQFLH